MLPGTSTSTSSSSSFKSHNRRHVMTFFIAAFCITPLLMLMSGQLDRYRSYINNNTPLTTITTINTPPSTTTNINNTSTTNFSSIWMSTGELNLLLNYLTRDVTNYLEWGSGGSTENFPRYVTGRYVSIEHDNAWCAKMKARVSSRVELRCISVARGTGGWGLHYPFEEGKYPVFKKYVDEIAEVSKVPKGSNSSNSSYSSYLYWDFVLIDGRCRVDAAIKALSFIRNNSIVALHDSHRLRKHYGDVHKYYDVVEEYIPEGARGLAILKRKKEFARLEGRPEMAQQIIDRKYNF